jgi:hypothetical protein
MKHTHLFVFCACSIFSAGCAYRGAVYSEYNQTALDIRASQASGAPVQVNFGYDRGVFAYVPKQNAETNSTQGEAVSVISWNNTATELNPTQTSSNSVLRADAGFISGIAADVASAPGNYQVNIVAPGLATNTVQTSGDPGARISAAIGHPTPYGPDENTEKIKKWLKSDPKTNTPLLRAWLDKNGYDQYGITNIEDGSEFAKARVDIATYFKIQ